MYIIFISQPPVLKAYNSFVPPPSHKLRGKKMSRRGCSFTVVLTQHFQAQQKLQGY